MDTHTLPNKLQDDELIEIRERWASMSPRDAIETSPQDPWLLLSHIQWLNDRLERTMEERDAHRDQVIRATGQVAAAASATTRRQRGDHTAYIALGAARNKNSTRWAVCTCNWMGPERASLELAVDDALDHEGSDHRVARRAGH